MSISGESSSQTSARMPTSFHIRLIISLQLAALLGAASSLANPLPEPIAMTEPILTRAESKESGIVNVRATINHFGYVVDAVIADSTNPALNRPSLEAMRRWAFQPAIQGGEATAMTIVQPFSYRLGKVQVPEKTAKDRSPRAIRKTAPTLPSELDNAMGKVVLEASLTERGEIDQISVRRSSHPELESAAIDALEKWVFKNALKNGEPAAAKVVIPFEFTGTDDPHEIRKPIVLEAVVNRAPRPRQRSKPTLPEEIERVSGAARILATVNERGHVIETEIIESDHEALSQAAAAAMQRWRFSPAIENGSPVAAKVLQPFRFNNGLFVAEKNLNSEPMVVSRQAPKLPEAIRYIDGQVDVELELDAAGRVATARIKKSSHAELEPAALKAASSWQFEPAKRKGEAVSSVIVVPFVFGKG